MPEQTWTVVIRREGIWNWWWHVLFMERASGHARTEAKARKRAAQAILNRNLSSEEKRDFTEDWTEDDAKVYLGETD